MNYCTRIQRGMCVNWSVRGDGYENERRFVRSTEAKRTERGNGHDLLCKSLYCSCKWKTRTASPSGQKRRPYRPQPTVQRLLPDRVSKVVFRHTVFAFGGIHHWTLAVHQSPNTLWSWTLEPASCHFGAAWKRS